MVQFFQSLWSWITSHAAVIAGIVTPANLVLVITNLWQCVRQRKAIAANTGSTRELRESLRETQALRDEAGKLSSRVAALEERVADLQDGMAQCLVKLNCVLDVQSEAYSVSLAKTQTLDAINGIIANGKYAETHNRKAIVDEVAEMREQLEKLTAATKASEAKVKRIAGVEDTVEKKGGVRYE